jgi:hypothetical protein
MSSYNYGAQNLIWFFDFTVRLTSLSSLWQLSRSCRDSGQGLDEQKSYKTMEIHNCTQTGKRTYIRTLYQKNKGSAKIEQRPIRMDNKTI